MKYAACAKCAKSVGMVNVFGNIMMILIKGYLGVVGDSKGLVADAIHSGADLLATIVMIIGMKISARPADKKYPYGYGKAEHVVAILIYLFLFVIACYIAFDGTVAILQKHQVVPCMDAAFGAILSIAINELMFRQGICAGSQINSPSMVAKAWETRSDVYSAIAVLIGIIGSRMGFHWMDPLAAIMVGLIILKICIESIKDSALKLMDKTVEEDIMEDVHLALGKVEHLARLRNMQARDVGSVLEFEMDFDVPADMNVAQGEQVKEQIKKALMDAIERDLTIKVRLFATSG
ncbi:MAG: cation transporter [Deltaproteobacteria bacterium]|nr:cation transporter [Deltaproteobacteria bacterium]